jgi:hypothetical protein
MKSRIAALAGLLVIAGLIYLLGWTRGASHEQAQAKALEHEQLRQAFEQGRQLGTVRDRVVTEYVDRVQVIEKRGQTIIKEVPVYVTNDDDAHCIVPAGFVRLHDAAAAGADLRQSPGVADEARTAAGSPAGG